MERMEVAAIELVDLIIQVSSSQKGLKYPEASASVVETKHPPRNYSQVTLLYPIPFILFNENLDFDIPALNN